MVVNINQEDYLPGVGGVAGVRLLVLPQNQMAFPEDSGITIGPGLYTSVGFDTVRLLLCSIYLLYLFVV